jgi:hypothetical protein
MQKSICMFAVMLVVGDHVCVDVRCPAQAEALPAVRHLAGMNCLITVDALLCVLQGVCAGSAVRLPVAQR